MRRSRWCVPMLVTGLAAAVTLGSGSAAEAGAVGNAATGVKAGAAAAKALAKPKPPPAPYTPLSPSPCGTMSTTDGLAHQIDHVVWVVFENKAQATFFGDRTKDPYLGGLALACGQAGAYQSTPYKPAKMAMVSGTDWGITKDAAVVAGPDLYSQLGTDWLQYMGDMPANCTTKDSPTRTYLTAHNSAVYFTDARAACLTQDVPLPATPAELDLSHKFTWIEANVPDSMHGCATYCPTDKWGQLARGDAWASTWVAGLTDTEQYRSGNTVIFVMFDQGGTATGSNTAFVAISPYTTPGMVSAVPYTHYSLLRGTEELLGLPLLAHAADPTTNSVASDFGLPYPPVVAVPPVDPPVEP
jgi:hypothetical protein